MICPNCKKEFNPKFSELARELGRLGGSRTSAAKKKSSRKNGQGGGRPRIPEERVALIDQVGQGFVVKFLSSGNIVDGVAHIPIPSRRRAIAAVRRFVGSGGWRFSHYQGPDGRRIRL